MKFATKGVETELTVNSILNKTTEAEIYRHYIGDFYLGDSMKAPYRRDNNPSFVVYKAKSGQLRWKDFGKGYNGGVFNLLMLLLNSTFDEVLEDIDKSMHLGIRFYNDKPRIEYSVYKDYDKIETKASFLQRIVQSYTQVDKEYWSSGNVSRKTLEYLEILSTKKLFLNGDLLWKYTDDNPIYTWEQDRKIKGYRPLEENKKHKWVTNFNHQIQGYNKLPRNGDILCITKSMKDIAVYNEIDIRAIAPQSEHVVITENVISELKQRFNYIFTNFDNDEAGITLSNKYKEEYNLDYFLLEDYKDPFEFSQHKGLTEFEKLINNFIK